MIDTLIQGIKASFDRIKDSRYKNTRYDLGDSLQCCFSMFHLKDPSLHQFRLAFSEREANLERVYGIVKLPADSTMRQAIDTVEPSNFKDSFQFCIEVIENQGVMTKYRVLGDHVSVLFDATEHYCNSTENCEHCLTKSHRNKKGVVTSTTYHHQALAAVIAHHGNKEVFPVFCEAILKQDGAVKNDCEINAAKRLIPVVAQMMSKYSVIGVFDGLYPNGPMIRLLKEHNMRFVIGIQEGYVLVQADKLKKDGALKELEWKTESKGRAIARWSNGLMLNGHHQDILVSYYEYEEFDAKGKRIYHNTWITDIEIDQDSIKELILVGRSRWKIENETFNTLKTQGYNLEHSYGHGKKYLTSNFMLLTFLAFLVDQITQRLDNAFDRAYKCAKTKKRLWEKVRQVFDLMPCMSMNVIYRFIAKEIKIDFPLLE